MKRIVLSSIFNTAYNHMVIFYGIIILNAYSLCILPMRKCIFQYTLRSIPFVISSIIRLRAIRIKYLKVIRTKSHVLALAHCLNTYLRESFSLVHRSTFAVFAFFQHQPLSVQSKLVCFRKVYFGNLVVVIHRAPHSAYHRKPR